MYMVELRGNPLLWVSSGEWSDLFKLLLFILPIKGKESTNKKNKKKHIQIVLPTWIIIYSGFYGILSKKIF